MTETTSDEVSSGPRRFVNRHSCDTIHALLAARIAATSCQTFSTSSIKRVPRGQASIWSFGCEWFAERHLDNDRGKSSNVLGKKAGPQKFLAGTTYIIVTKVNNRSGYSKYWLPHMASRAESLRAVWPDNPEFSCVKGPVLRGLIGCKQYHSDTPNVIATR